MDGLQGEAAPETKFTTGNKAPAGNGGAAEKEAGGEKQYTDVEVLAMKMGWNPEHNENSGRPFKGADQYIIDSKQIQDTTVKTLNSLKETNEELVAGMQNLRVHQTKVAKAEKVRIDEKIAELNQKKDQAIEDADKGKVKEVDGQIETLQNSKKDIEETASQPAKSVPAGEANFKTMSEKWMGDNSWYGKNQEMTSYIDTQSERFKGLPNETYFEKLTETAMVMFPEAFKGQPLPGKQPATQQQTVVGGQTRQSGPGAKQKFTFNDLSPDQQKWASFYEKNKVMSRQEYVDEQVKIGNIQ